MFALLLATMLQAPSIEDRLPIEQRFAADDTPMETASKISFRWDLCLFATGRKFSRSAERADVVAEAAFGDCTDFERLYRRAIVLATPAGVLSPADFDAVIASYKAKRRPMIIADVIKHRQAGAR